ncbi:hypothetical protein [Paraburkholderia sp. WSM4177]|uniref:hypothetical protein n=1 Tax=unclassified Paraburkholderia TaxID=2615204 RepID=UPI001849B54E|nr:hypothetical protein [Paraburkholderia sp. WSM4177]MBB5488339.1 hypothetical protein [Paraburkholderia sp. WSM4180]
MSSAITVGVIANPASGRDIRRLTTHASVFPTAEKANMVVRLLAGLGMLGVARVLTLRDRTGVAAPVLRALESHAAVAEPQPWPTVEFLELPITDSAADTGPLMAQSDEYLPVTAAFRTIDRRGSARQFVGMRGESQRGAASRTTKRYSSPRALCRGRHVKQHYDHGRARR